MVMAEFLSHEIESGFNDTNLPTTSTISSIIKKIIHPEVYTGAISEKTKIAYKTEIRRSPSRDLNTGPADYKSAALPAKPLRRHIQ